MAVLVKKQGVVLKYLNTAMGAFRNLSAMLRMVNGYTFKGGNFAIYLSAFLFRG